MSEISREDKNKLVELLEKCRVVQDPQGRMMLVQQLPVITSHFSYAPSLRLFLISLVDCCSQYESVAELRSELAFLEGNTCAMQAVSDFIEKLLAKEISKAQAPTLTEGSFSGLKGRVLVNLLMELFDGPELRQWVHLELGESLAQKLPGNSVSLSELTFQTVHLIKRNGRINKTFFDSLIKQRPHQRDSILAVQKEWFDI